MIKELTDFPAQKKLEREKTKDWAEKCVKAACDKGIFNENYLDNYKEMSSNIDLYNGILDTDDMLEMCDPFGLNDQDYPFKPQHYPIANTKINVLAGEEIKRRFEWGVHVINPDAISIKERDRKKEIDKKLRDIINSSPDQDLARELRNLDSFMKFEYQDVRERNATHLIRHMIEKEDMRTQWNHGFIDGLVAGGEIYRLDIVGGDPRIRKVNMRQIQSIRRGSSPDIRDSDIIIEWGYMSKGNIIDDFADVLKSDQVTQIDEYGSAKGKGGEAIATGKESSLLAGTFSMIEDANGNLTPSTISADTLLSPISEDGAVLVTRVVWRSYRKIGKLKYYDRKTGEQLYRFVDEFYKPRVERGEEVEKYIWVTDWWEGTRIGEDIYCKMRPFPVKAYGMNNPTGTICPYVGGYYTVDGEPITSLFGRMKPHSYYYDFMMYKQWETLSKHKGVIGYLDLAMIPEGWATEDALFFAERMGWLPIDSFKEGNKGQATGKLAGNMNTNRSPMNFDMGSYLQQNILIMNFLKEEMSQISGVTPQREGTITSNELVGNTERSVTQSSHVTELYFHYHDRIKIETLKAVLELAKYAYRDRKVAINYVTDDMSKISMEIDGNDIREIDYGLTVTNAPEYTKMRQDMIQILQVAIGRDTANLQQAMDILIDPSVSSMRRKIESTEIQKEQREAQAAEQQSQMAREIEAMRGQNAKELEAFRAELQASLENLKTDGKIDHEKMRGEMQRLLKQTLDTTTVYQETKDVEKLNMQHEHEAEEKQLDRESAEHIASKRTAKSS